MPALISTIENFLDIHGKATKSDDFSSNVLEKKVMEKLFVNCIIGCHGNTLFDAIFGEILFFSIFQILTKYLKQLVILSLEVNLGICFGTS